MKIPLLLPEMPNTDELIPWLRKIDENKLYTNFGPLNYVLENSLSDIFSKDVKAFVSTVANCTIGLELGLRALNLRNDASILAPSLSFAATGTSIVNCGYSPIFSDIDPSSWVLTPEIAYDIAKNHHIDAVIPVATFGLGLDVLRWDSFTKDTGIPVLIDAASAFGNQEIGYGTKAVFSLHATKSLGSGEGGFISTPDEDFIQKIKKLSNFGIEGIDYDGYINQAGTNAKMSEYHAAVALASLKKWDAIKTNNQTNYSYYLEKLEENQIQFIAQEGGSHRNHTLLPIRIKSKVKTQKIIETLAGDGIQSRRWYCPLLSEYNCFRNYSKNCKTVNANEISSEILGLPFFPSIKSEQIDIVVEKLRLITATR